jgi:hypothetical protein
MIPTFLAPAAAVTALLVLLTVSIRAVRALTPCRPSSAE